MEYNIIYNDKDFGLLCVCAVRYALLRATYMPSEVIRIIKENIDLLDYNSIYVIKRDIREHLDGEHPYMFEYDKQTWEDFYEWLCTDRNYEVE